MKSGQHSGTEEKIVSQIDEESVNIMPLNEHDLDKNLNFEIPKNLQRLTSHAGTVSASGKYPNLTQNQVAEPSQDLESRAPESSIKEDLVPDDSSNTFSRDQETNFPGQSKGASLHKSKHDVLSSARQSKIDLNDH
jgi:hypothetical protein